MAEQQQRPEQLGHYRLLRLLGQGGFAEVYLGEHIHLKTAVAVKILHTRLAENDIENFRREAQTVARLLHPHIVRVLDFGVEQTIPYLVMDYAPNGSLRHLYPRGTALPLATAVELAGQVADALQYAHDQRLIHRDVKPENMLLGPRREVLLSDFGLALVLQSSSRGSTQDIAGTVAYMAPEQIQAHPVPASDQYALGVVVYEWLCGKRPFEGSYTEIAVKQSITPPPPLHESVPALPEPVEQAVMRALQKDPRQRFPSVRDFAQALAEAAQPTARGVISERFIPTFVKSPPAPTSVSALPTQRQPAPAPANVGPALTPLPGVAPPVLQPGTMTPPGQSVPDPSPSGPQGGQFTPPAMPYAPPVNPGGGRPSSSLATPPTHPMPTTWSTQGPQQQTPPSSASWTVPFTPRPAQRSRRGLIAAGILGVAALGSGGWLLATYRSITIPGVGTVNLPDVDVLPDNPELTYKDHDKLVWLVGWSPNGKYIASGSFDNTLKIWSADKGETLLSARSTKQPQEADDYPWSLSWSPQNNLLAVSFVDGSVQVFDPAKNLRVGQLEQASVATPKLAWSPDERYIAIAASGSDNPVHIHAYPSWEIVQTYTGHTDWVNTLAWSPDGKYIATGSKDTKVHVWEPLTAKLKIMYTKHTDDVSSVGWSPDSKQVISTAQDHNAVAWQVETGSVTFTYKGTGGAPMGMATWSPNGKHIALYDGNAQVVLLDATNGETKHTISSGAVYGISWSPDSTKLVAGCYDNVAKIWSLRV